jgi:hypothetical protein
MSDENIMSINSPTTRLEVSTVSSSVPFAGKSDFLRIVNLGSSEAYVKTGTSTVAAVLYTNLCIAPGATETFRYERVHTHIAAISTGNCILSISNVEGV